MTAWLQTLQMHEIILYGLVFGLPIVVIGFSSVETIVKALIKHRERLAMIERGFDPDYYPEQPEIEDPPAPWSGARRAAGRTAPWRRGGPGCAAR